MLERNRLSNISTAHSNCTSPFPIAWLSHFLKAPSSLHDLLVSRGSSSFPNPSSISYLITFPLA